MKTLFFVLVATLSIGSPAGACTCIADTVSGARDWADLVFAGEIKHIKQWSNPGQDGTGLLVTFQVADIWKGDVRRTAKIFISSLDIACTGTVMQNGDRFIVYARQNGTNFAYAKTCIRTSNIKNADEDMRILGRGRFPQK